MRASEFDYELPPGLIAQYPLERRRDSRLLVLGGERGELEDRRFRDLPELLSPGDLLVLNDTRVVAARLAARKASGGKVEILVERIVDERRFLAHLKSSRAPRAGTRLEFEDGVVAHVTGRRDDLFELELAERAGIDDLLERSGRVPLPPYIRRPPEALDAERYQTVYARERGAVAAPTAGLHFDEAMLRELAAKGVAQAAITLHVGAGTFQPVRADEVEDHVMHAEWAVIPATVCERVAQTRARGGRVVAVGTTCVRALETAAAGGELRPFEGETCLFIYPGYRFQCVDALLTNFHLPRSTLLMLVCAFAGRERVLAAYRHAVTERYRFYSYGDAMLVARRHE